MLKRVQHDGVVVRKFRFKLQTLLDHRRAKEELLQAQLGAIIREESAELARLDRLRQRLTRAWTALETALNVDTSPAEVLRLDEYAKTLRDDIKVQHLTIEAVRERLEAKRVEVTEAMKERKVIEALRDKQEREYLSAHMRADQAVLDEMASLRYVTPLVRGETPLHPPLARGERGGSRRM